MSLSTTQHIYSSRGRTRQPKNLAKPYHESVANAKANGNVAMVTASTDLSETLVGTAAGTNGYDTQNQDFLHLCMSQGSGSRNIDIYAYNRCFGTWGLLKVPVSNAASLDAMYVNARIQSDANAVTYVTIPIHGIDRVAFVCGTQTNLTLYAAGSTI